MDASVLNYTVNDNVASFLNKNQKLYIGGKWVDTNSSKTFDVEDPATGKKLSTCAAGNSNDIDLAVKAAREAFDSGKWTGIPANERGKIIWKIGDLIDNHTEELAQLESLDNGKPVVGILHNPATNETFHASHGCGSFLNEERFEVTKKDSINTPIKFKLVNIDGNSYYETLREKLFWGKDKRN